jgi:hypothetical protein
MVIKTLETENPFADYGNIVEGTRFIGRKAAITTIHNRVLGKNYGNIAIMGLPRIGKSSLAWNALMIKRKDFAKRNIIIERINVGSIKLASDFYLRLMDKTINQLQSVNHEISKQLLDVRNLYVNNNTENEIEFFFCLVKQFGYRLIFILDQFDNVANFFSLEDFQLLRELSISPETKICLVTISRRTIQELEPANGAISNFYGVFSDLRLGVFNNEDLIEYWGRLEKYQIEISEAYKSSVYYLVGGHPYFIDLYNYEVFKSLNNSDSKILNVSNLEIEREIRLTLFNNFENILNLLKDEGLYTKAIQLILGPVYDVTSIDEQKLLKYEFIKLVESKEKFNILKQDIGVKIRNNNYSYVCFSDYFTELMNLKLSDIEYWPLWNQTEKSVRELIKDYLEVEMKGENWEDFYVNKHKNSEGKMKGIQKLVNVRNDTINKFGGLASTHLVDYTFPRDMYDLFISSDWNWFSRILDESQKVWSKRFISLAEIRNPIAHNNSEFISLEELNNAKAYCNLILDRINEWKENKDR